MTKKPRRRRNAALNQLAHDVGLALPSIFFVLKEAQTTAQAREQLGRLLADITLDHDDSYVGPIVAGALAALDSDADS